MRDLRRRVVFLGVAVPVLSFIASTATTFLVIFRFDGGMMLNFLYITLITTVIVVPPAALLLYYRTRKAFDALGPEGAESAPGEGSEATARLKAVDGYPLSMAVTVLFSAIVAIIIEALLFYFMADYNGVLSVIIAVTGQGLALYCAYIEFYLLYRLLGPVRRKAYARLFHSGYRGASSLRWRIANLGMILALCVLIMGWSLAVTSSIFGARDRAGERGLDRVFLIAKDTAAIEDWRVEKPYASALEEYAFAENELLYLVSPAGEVVDEMALGAGIDADGASGLLRDLLGSEGDTAFNRALTLAAARADVGGSGYTLVLFFPPGTFASDALSLTFLYLLLGFAILSVAYLLAHITARTVTEPVEEMRAAADAVAEGDLTARIEMSSSDEIGMLSAAFSGMLSSLHAITEQTMHAAEETSSGAEGVAATAQQIQASLNQLSGIIEQMAENASREAKMAEDVYSLSTEIHDALRRSTEQADEGAEASTTSSRLAEGGRDDAAAAIASMGSVMDSINETVEIIKTLGEQSEEIGIVGDVIDNIADQTNLLALNAAIEAARAQEHGRGFSVVAEEVRKLAEESTKSTARIANLVREIQRNTAAAVERAERAAQEVSSGMQAVRVAGDSLEKINEYVQRSAELSRAIAETSKHHLELGGRIMEAMEEIRAIADMNASNSEEISASSEEQSASMQELSATSTQLTSLAEKMRSLVERYKL